MGTESKLRRASVIGILLVLLVSMFLLSVLSNILTEYPERQNPPDTEEKRKGKDVDGEPSVVLFKVSPATPRLFWSISTADYYTGFNWLRTTDEKVLEEFPQVENANASKTFTVEIDLRQQETLLPLPPPTSTLANPSLVSADGLKFYRDIVGGLYKAVMHGQGGKVQLVYNVSWHDTEVDDKLISLDNIPEEILNKYMQLPDLPIEVWELAKALEDSSYSILDQVLADVQYLRTNFVYDVENSRYLYEYLPQGSDVSSYLQRRKGICMDAATALAVILRIQKTPARISIGYKPRRIENGKLLYCTTEAHALTEVYLPPYGWTQFDATPPLKEDPLVKVLPFKKESPPGSRLFYQLSITNRCNSTDNFKLFVDSKEKWTIEAAPEELSIEALQTADALLEVNVPENASTSEKSVVTVTVASLSQPEVAFSILAIAQVENTLHVFTATRLRNIEETVNRGDTFWANGTVLTVGEERVDNMPIFIFLTKGREAEGVIIGKGYSKQGKFQVESTVPHFMEIGDYKVVPIFLGTAQYAPSSSEYTIRVRATTIMELSSEEEFLLGYGSIDGRLSLDNGTGLAEAPVSFEITSFAIPSQVWKSQTLTFEGGFFKIETIFENPGVYEVEATFPGDEYVSESSTTHVLRLKIGLPAIQIFSENVAVRGKVFNITGAVKFKDLGVCGEPVMVAFDNQLLTTIETRDEGSFSWSLPVGSEEELGLHVLTVALEKGNVSTVHEVVVKSNTTLATKVSDVGGMFLLFSATLSDDHGLPIRGAEIDVDDYGLSWKTGRNGNLTFLLDTFKLWPENLVLTARFEGSASYLPVTTEEEVVLRPVTSLLFLIPLVAPTLVVIVSAYTRYYLGRQRASRQTNDLEVVEEMVMAEEEYIYRPREVQPLKIALPDIETQFPNVWGFGDKLRMEIVPEKSLFEKTQTRWAEVLIDEENVASVRLSKRRRAELSHVFNEKGEHVVRAILRGTSERRPWSVEIKVRIVDYGEEIIRLYNEFLGKLAGYGLHERNEMTAREIESAILGMSDVDPEALCKVTTCFEKAEYSNHPTTRKDYETTYLSLRELNINIDIE